MNKLSTFGLDVMLPEGTELPGNLTDSDNIIILDSVHATTRWDDATWILTSAFIIFTMQSGFGLLESGSVSQKNEVNIMVKNAVDVLFGGISYWSFGYGFSFGLQENYSNGFIGFGDFFVDAKDEDEGLGRLFSHFFFHASFATTATTIVSGAMAERSKLEAYIVFSFVNTFIYVFPAHWMWAENGWLKAMGALDIAGSGAVHLVGGVTGFVATMMMKPRAGRFKDGAEAPAMGSPTNAIFGMFMLWWGWLGFNCGSTYGITNKKWILAARSAVTTITASVGGGISGILLSYVTKRKKLDVTYLINGVLGSLVAISALCALARPWEGILIGAIGGLLACAGCRLSEKLRIDDPVGVVPVHGVSGIWGLLSVGLFAERDQLDGINNMNGLFAGGGWQLMYVQVLSIVTIVAWTAFWSLICFKLLDVFIGLRVPLHEEILGADIVEHSLNGTFNKKTGEWRDLSGKLLMVVKKDQPLEYYDSIIEIQASMYRGSCFPEDVGNVRKSAFGFSRNSDLEGDTLAMETVTELEIEAKEKKNVNQKGSDHVPRRRLLWRKDNIYTVNGDKIPNGHALDMLHDYETRGIYNNLKETRNNRGIGSSPIDGSI